MNWINYRRFHFLIDQWSDLLDWHLLFKNSKGRFFYHVIFLHKRSRNVVYNSTYTFSTYREDRMKKKRTKPTMTEWVLCSEDWRDIVVTHVLQINNIAIEDNYASTALEEIKKGYLKHDKWRKPHKRVKSWLHMLSLIYNIAQKFFNEIYQIYV